MTRTAPQQGNQPQPQAPQQQQGSTDSGTRQQGGGQQPPRFTDWASI